MGRPSDFDPSYCTEAAKLCQLGATDVELADFFQVSLATISNWKRRYPEFLDALKMGKEVADQRVEHSLYHRAVGYTYDAVKIFCGKDGEVTQVPFREHIPPDTTACIFWLKNRRQEQWRDRTDVNVRHEHVQQLSDDELQRIAAGGSKGVIAPPASPSKLN